MREHALNILKETIPLQDAYEELGFLEKQNLADLENEYNTVKLKLSDEDRKWVDDRFADWYKEYLEVHSKTVKNQCGSCGC